MTTDSAQKTFIKLKLFPRMVAGFVDTGRTITDDPYNVDGKIKCQECNVALTQSVSLEYCPMCGWIARDYWQFDYRNRDA